MEHPPQIDSYQVVHSQRLRFTALSAVNSQAFTYQNLLDAMLVATSATVVYDLFELVRIKRIQVWAIASLGTPATVEVVFDTTTGDRTIHSDTSLGVKPAYVSCRPSSKSLASFYQVSGAGAAFLLTVPIGAIIDIHCSFKTTGAAPVQAANAAVGATVGEFYFRSLDGLAVASSQFPPPAGIIAI